MINRLDHVNVLTANLEDMVSFYTNILGLETGWRPGFDIGGAWLYCDGRPIIHLVDRPDTAGQSAGRLEHFALAGTDFDGLMAHLDSHDIQCDIVQIPGTQARSVNLEDPDHNHIEVIFGVLPVQHQGSASS